MYDLSWGELLSTSILYQAYSCPISRLPPLKLEMAVIFLLVSSAKRLEIELHLIIHDLFISEKKTFL